LAQRVLQVEVTNYCTQIDPGYNAQSFSVTTSDFAGLDASQPFRFADALAASTTHSLSPDYCYGSNFSVTVHYTY
jgi:hypothetical protein